MAKDYPRKAQMQRLLMLLVALVFIAPIQAKDKSGFC